MLTSPYEKYRQSTVQTSTPGQLLLMLYDGAVRFTRLGIDAIGTQNIEKANNNFGKAQTIITELSATLDPSYEVSERLSTLYEYMNHLLIEANVKKQVAPAEEVIGYLTELRDTWAQAMRTTGGLEVSHG